MQLFTKYLANSFLGQFSLLQFSRSALWRATSSLFWKNHSYGNDPMAYGIISRFLWKREFDSVITSQIYMFLCVPHFSGFMYDHQIWLSCMQTMHVHHILASSLIIHMIMIFDHQGVSSWFMVVFYYPILASSIIFFISNHILFSIFDIMCYHQVLLN